MRRVALDRPFIEGMNTDQPPHKLSARNSVFAQDLVAPEGIAKQRHGWAYDGTTADAADTLISVTRNKFLLADQTYTLTCDDDGDIFIHNSGSAGTQVFSGSVPYLPRCVYRDEVIWCAQDGTTPLRRYSGASFTSSPLDDGVATGVPDTPSGQAIIKDLNFASNPGVGAYVRINATTGANNGVPIIWRLVEASQTQVTLEDALSTTSDSYTAVLAYSTGTVYPCVPIYGSGTVTYNNATNAATGVGTKWSTGSVTIDTGSETSDAMLVFSLEGSPAVSLAQHFRVTSVNSDTSITMSGGDHANISNGAAYQITRRAPFKDAAVHKGSLWGTGVAQYPNNVYVGPPGWNLSLPPGSAVPYDPFGEETSENANDFVMDSIAVPTAYEGDVNVAILSSPSPLLVLKRSAVYGIFGTYPNFTQDKIVDGAGCIDLRSAISGPWGQFWAGEDDIYTYRNAQVVPLMEGKIGREWQALIRDFDFGTSDYCAIGEASGHLFVSLVTGSGATNRCYVYDIKANAWMSRFTNHKARYFFSSKVDGERSELYWVGDNQLGRVMKSSGAVDGTSPAKDGDGSSPRMQAWTPQGIDGSVTIDNDSRLLDLSVAHNVYDTGAAGSTSMAVSVVTGGSLEANADATKTLTDIDSDSVDRVDRTRFRTVNAKGRLAQVRFDVDTLGTNAASTKIEIHEVTGTFRERRSRT